MQQSILAAEMGNEEEEEKWVKHYSSNQRILLVGEGDFSFSSCLARFFRSASDIVATSLDTYDVLVGKYKKAKRNMEMLLKLGASTFHGVDATKMKLHSDLKMQKFDRIIFNFPRAGFHGKEADIRLIERHKKLVQGFFKNASGLLRAEGEIHVSHRTSYPFNCWDITELARKYCLGLVDCVDFKKEDYPGYNNKRGDKQRCDEPFRLGECCTFKFRLFPAIRKMSEAPIRMDNARIRSETSISYPFEPNYQPTPVHRPLGVGNAYQLGSHLNRTSEIYRMPVGHYLSYGTPRFDYERSLTESFGRSQQYQYRRDPYGLSEFGSYTGAPLSISTTRGSLDGSARYCSYAARREAWRQDVSIYDKYSGGTHGYERSDRNVLYNGERNGGNGGDAFGFGAV